MLKQVQFRGKTETGTFAQALFGSAGVFEKVAGAPAFSDWETGDALRQFIKKLTKKDRDENAYVLVNALGASEYFGPNINADWFTWDGLSHEGMDYGYQTFLNAHAFQHHVNKDATRAFGRPVLSLLNRAMKRVELIVELNRAKARYEGAEGVLARVDAGEFPDVSMGTKVPEDYCYICGHASKTKDDYCIHMRPPMHLRHLYGPLRVLPDGRIICVINRKPRFFDISFVFIGADKTAKVMAKLASTGQWVCLGDICTLDPQLSADVAASLVNPDGSRIWVPGSIDKTASACCSSCESGAPCAGDGMDKLAAGFGVKKTAAEKLSEIIKSVPADGFALNTLPSLEADEPDISPIHLDDMAHTQPVAKILGSLASMGLLLKPHEFQRLILVRMGEADRAEELDQAHRVFRQLKEFDDSIPLNPEAPLSSILDFLESVLSKRTVFGDSFRMRVIKAETKKALPTREQVTEPLLDKISAAYNGYRRSFLMKLSQAAEVANSDLQLREKILGEDVVSMFTKKASRPVISLETVKYVAGAHFRDRGQICNTAGAAAAVAGNDGLLDGLEDFHTA